jgi:hypothetical protein
MGHCISVFLLRKEELRNSKLETILEDKTQNQIKFTELDGGVLATTNIPNIKEFGKDKTIAKIETDYFGGAGHQEGKLFVNNEKKYEGSSEFNWSERPINTILMKMGIEPKPGMDLFDTIGLGRYRSNKDFN